jgi:hypothetical protein
MTLATHVVKGTERHLLQTVKEPAMAQFRSQDASPGYDPAPNVATAAEIRLAEELRRRLEERYLSGATVSPSLPVAASNNVH